MDNEKRTPLQNLMEQQKWYSSIASKYKRWDCYFSIVNIVLLSVQVIIASLDAVPLFLRLVLAVILAALQGLSAYFKFHDKWIQYRMVSESLKSQKRMYDAGIDVYDCAEDERDKRLAEQLESIIQTENVDWSKLMNILNDKNTLEQK